MSILDSQKRVSQAQEEVRIAEEFLQLVKGRLEKAISLHRTEIVKGMSSKDSEEKRMATSIARFWEVPFPAGDD